MLGGPGRAAAPPAGPLPAERLDLTPWRGQVVLVDFWASWCIPCRQSFPWMQSMLARHGRDGLVVLTVNVGESREAADAFTARFPAGFAYRYDPDGEIAASFGIDAMPSSILFDRTGRPIYRHSGFVARDTAAYEEQIVSLLGAGAADSQSPLTILPATGDGVRPWERGVLARESMRLDADLITLAFDDHVYFSKEASSGGRSFGGGGCGCN